MQRAVIVEALAASVDCGIGELSCDEIEDAYVFAEPFEAESIEDWGGIVAEELRGACDDEIDVVDDECESYLFD